MKIKWTYLACCCLFSIWTPLYSNALGYYVQPKRIVLVPVTLRAGMEGPSRVSGALTNIMTAQKNKVFVKNQLAAQKAGINLLHDLNKACSAGYQNGQFFLLFYNTAHTMGCNREFLIQRVKITKRYFTQDNKEAKPTEELFLVEMLKVNRLGQQKRADEHFKRYSIGDAFRRKVVVECEIGWGRIPNKLEAYVWPSKSNTLYNCIQDYSPIPGLYQEVQFEWSQKYSYAFEIAQNGQFLFQLPFFINANTTMSMNRNGRGR